ncbi:MAG TPA: sigma 54-interacting transcriptional regulator [Planctomycetaceae bacterium]|nr:sigma 54-interacting transcriptional regulator [Planctomycetaceae bacterium]
MSKSRNVLERRLVATTAPVFVLSADREIVFVNRGCEQLTGWPASEIVGRVCQYASVAGPATPESLAASLCPPPEVFEGREAAAPAYVTVQEGPPVARMIHFFPLLNDAGKLDAVLGILAPMRTPPAAVASPTQRLHAELGALRAQLRMRFADQNLIAGSPAMAKVLNQLALAQRSSACVYLRGEPGTGREHLARVVHFGGPHRANWFVPLDCKRLGAEEIERILNRLIELHLWNRPAAGRPQPGTLYLAEIEHLPRDLQATLAESLGKIKAGEEPALRLMAGGSRDLDEAAAEGTLRPDLVALVTTLTIELPPLRERGDDVPLLAQHFLEDANRQRPRQLGGFSPEVLQQFARYAWPGNLDELSQVIREAAEHCEENLLRPVDLPFRFRTALDAHELPPPPEPRLLPLDEALTRVETNLIRIALERSQYNKSKAADRLGINRPRLYRRMQQLGIEDREPGAD